MNIQIDGAAPLACQTRSGVPDNVHRGAAVAVDDAGRVLLSFGDPGLRGYIRSAAKPIQAIPVLTSGAPDAFGLDDADVAIICGSHRGGDEQVAQVRSILAKAGLDERCLQSGSGIRDNCSGKHSGKLAACKHMGYALDSYLDPGHPHQRAILQTLCTVCNLAETDVHIGVDGCSAPIHYMPVLNMALGFARLSRPEQHFDDATAAAAARIRQAMWRHPGGHTGEPEYRDVFGDPVKLLTKSGGSGVYCAGVVGQGVGFAMKVEDGSGVPLKPVFFEFMRRLGVFSDAQAEVLLERFGPKTENRRGQTVGRIELLF